MRDEFEKLLKKEDIRATLSTIRSEVKDQEQKEELLKLLDGKEELLETFLMDEDAKTRKNAALLIGDIKLQSAKDALLEAYAKEQTLFVKSSYLTALKQLDTEEDLAYFKERLMEQKDREIPENEKKHAAEEIRELSEIIAKYEGIKKHVFCGLKEPHEMLLLTNREQREATLTESREAIGAAVQRKAELHPLGVLIFSKEVLPFAKLRTYRELLFPIHTEGKLPKNANEAAKLLWESDLYRFLT